MRTQCHHCSGTMRVSGMLCEECGLGLQGDFHTPRILRLTDDEQKFVELFVLSSGSLKEMAEKYDVSYPTIRNRLDQLISRLKEEAAKDQERKEQVLKDIEAGKITAKHGARIIEAL